jgi:hypothetical protein
MGEREREGREAIKLCYIVLYHIILYHVISYYTSAYRIISSYILFQYTCSSCDILYSNSFNLVILVPIGEGEVEKEGEKGGEKEVVAEGERLLDLS